MVMCLIRWTLFPRGTEISVSDIPFYRFTSDEVVYNFNTTNNTIKTPKGYFRICLVHLVKKEYLTQLKRLYESVPENQRPERGYDFFVRKGLRDWRLNGRKYRYQTYNACSSLAEEKVAELLGLERLLTRSHFCRVSIDGGEELVGTMASFAEGVDVRMLKDTFQDVFTPELAKEVSNLNIVDAICYEKDHRPGNYHIILNKIGKAVSISCFDNDSPWCFSPFGSVDFTTYGGASSIIDQSGRINRCALDKCVIDKLLALTKKDVVTALSPYLGSNQVNACWKRVVELQRAIQKTEFRYDKWTEETVREELSGRYGRTYYVVLWELCEAIKKGIR